MSVRSIQPCPPNLGPAKPEISKIAVDPKDANRDGVVSATEEIAYAVQHPELEPLTTSSNHYTQTGTVRSIGVTRDGSLNLFA